MYNNDLIIIAFSYSKKKISDGLFVLGRTKHTSLSNNQRHTINQLLAESEEPLLSESCEVTEFFKVILNGEIVTSIKSKAKKTNDFTVVFTDLTHEGTMYGIVKCFLSCKM